MCASGAERVVVPAGAASHPPEHSGICCTPAKRREISAELSALIRVMCAVQAAGRWVLLQLRHYLHGADHGTEREHSSRVSQRGLAVERSLGVHQQHGHLQAKGRITSHACNNILGTRKIPFKSSANEQT